MVKRNWFRNSKYQFCFKEETIHHMFFD
jgi:hypothetical protein